MPSFSASSNQKLITCDIRLIRLFDEVIKHIDCTVLVGHRNEADQNKAFAEGNSQKKWPDSKHNSNPSKAVDVAPWPLDWEDTNRFYYFAGIVMGIAKTKGIPIRFGGDWDRDNNIKENRFNDLVHFEIAE